MVLDEMDRGRIEKGIDIVVSTMPGFVKMMRTGAIRKQMPLKDEDDFITGISWGLILGMYLPAYEETHQKSISSEDMATLLEIMVRRTKEIRDSIFNTG